MINENDDENIDMSLQHPDVKEISVKLESAQAQAQHSTGIAQDIGTEEPDFVEDAMKPLILQEIKDYSPHSEVLTLSTLMAISQGIHICNISPPGCLTGDTEIRTNRASLGRKHTLKWMYNQFHDNPDKLTKMNQLEKKWDLKIPTYVRSYNGKNIRLHKIKDVIYSGKKEVYFLILEDETSIKATYDHKIMTNKGFIELGKLDKEDLIMCDDPNTHSSKRKKKSRYKEVTGLRYHPYKRGKGRDRVAFHRLVYEANMNKITIENFIKIVSGDEKKSKKLKYVSPEFIIHHKDFNSKNDSLENLQKVTEKEHRNIHKTGDYGKFNQGNLIYKKIKEIVYSGIEDTYDIVCDEPYHNFVANGIVVHNSGKSRNTVELLKMLRIPFNLIAGHTTPRQFFSVLQKDGILVVDEGATILSDKNIINLLLNALWNGKVEWKNNKELLTHDFKGIIIFNVNVLSNTGLSEALKDRIFVNDIRLTSDQIKDKIMSGKDYQPNMRIWAEIRERLRLDSDIVSKLGHTKCPQDLTVLDANNPNNEELCDGSKISDIVQQRLYHLIENGDEVKSVREMNKLKNIGLFSYLLVGDLSLVDYFRKTDEVWKIINMPIKKSEKIKLIADAKCISDRHARRIYNKLEGKREDE